jgi:GNAT superfamily N-acetyltransferase
VRRARPDDLEAIVRLRLALVTAEGRRARGRPGEAWAAAHELTRRQLTVRSAPFFVATDCGRVVGLVRVAATRGSPITRDPDYGTLTTAYVAPGYRRRGIMRHLVSRVLAWCSTHGLAEVRLRCDTRNALGNAAWDALGFGAVAIVRSRRVR